MSEPRFTASRIDEVLPGIRHWGVMDDRISFRSDAYVLEAEGETVLVDPLPLADDLWDRLGSPTASVLTGSFHQRAAWRAKQRFGCPIWAPRSGRGLDREPDHQYEDGEVLPGGLRAIHAPGPAFVHYVLLHETAAREAVLFTGDLLMRPDEDAPFGFVPSRYQENPDLTRETVRGLLEIRPFALLPAHGAPLVGGAVAAIEVALERKDQD